MIYEKKGVIRKYDVQSLMLRTKNPNIKSVVVYTDRDKKSVETMTKMYLKDKSPFTVFFVRD